MDDALDESARREPLRAALYGRVSTRRQAGKRREQLGLVTETSLDHQERRLRAYARAQGWRVARQYQDPAQSGKSLDRPEVQKLIADIRAGLVDVVMVWKMDRISRSLKDFMGLWELFKRCGVTFVSLSENFDTSTAMGEAMLQLVMVFAELERKQTAERTRARMHERAERGKWNGGAVPYGYRVSPLKCLVPDPRTRHQVPHLFDLYLSLQSTLAVAEKLRELYPGRKIRRGGGLAPSPWSASNVANILRNPVYSGLTRYRKNRGTREEEVLLTDGEHEPLVPRETWELAQELLDTNRRNRRSPRRRTLHGLSVHGLLRCRCGQPMRLESHWGGQDDARVRYFYAACRHSKGRARGRRCQVKPVLGKLLEAATLEVFTQLVEDEGFAEKALDEHRRRTLRKLRNRDERLKRLATKRKATRRERARLPSLAARSRRLQAEELELERRAAELEALTLGPLPTRANLVRLQQAVEGLRESYRTRTPPERQALLERHLEEVTWDGERVTLCFRASATETGQLAVPEGLRVESLPVRGPRVCVEPGCTAEVHARGLCRSHYRQALTGGGKPGHTAPGKGRLTPSQREEIRVIYRLGGVSYRDLGKIYGVSQVTVGRICREEAGPGTTPPRGSDT